MAVITITDQAAAQIRKLLAKNEADGAQAMRVGVKARGCSGQSYVVDYCREIKPGDEIIKQNDVVVHVDAPAMLMLFGTVMDYREDKFSSGFVFNNPNEKGRCGCGESFHV